MSPQRHAVAVLAIGTEITSGQIIDTNSAWLSRKLTDLRYDVALHLSVRDDEQDILAALRFAAARWPFLIVTGGLGPTTDDKTRMVLAAWADVPLAFHEDSWRHIEERLNRLKVPVAPSNRQQALFPRGARVIPNHHGTANAFYFEAHGCRVWSLPGPPLEIQGLWDEGLGEEFAALNPGAQALRLARYHCLGLSESRLGEVVEEAVAGSRFVTGYRPHMPYVEVKIWCEMADWDAQKEYFRRLEAAIGPWLVNRDDEDLARDFAKVLAARPGSRVLDRGSRGFLAERLLPALRKESVTDATVIEALAPWDPTPEAGAHPHFVMSPIHADGTWQAAWRNASSTRWQEETLRLPWAYTPAHQDRMGLVAAELTLQAWLRMVHAAAPAHG